MGYMHSAYLNALMTSLSMSIVMVYGKIKTKQGKMAFIVL